MVKAYRFLVIAGALFLGACGDGSSSFQLEPGKKYTLKEWPDSTYLAIMDSIVASEVVRAPDAPPPEVSINPMLKSIDPMQAKETPAANPTSQLAQKAVEQGTAKRQEAFAQRFQEAMDRLMANPANPAFSLEATLREGESLGDLLRRVYGADAERLPAFLVKSQVESLNGGALQPGKTLRLPKL